MDLYLLVIAVIETMILLIVLIGFKEIEGKRKNLYLLKPEIIIDADGDLIFQHKMLVKRRKAQQKKSDCRRLLDNYSDQKNFRNFWLVILGSSLLYSCVFAYIYQIDKAFGKD